jgi:hypothetical protein
MANKKPNPNDGNGAAYAQKITALSGAAFTIPALVSQDCCFGIQLLSSGTLQWTNRFGVQYSLTGLPAGFYPIEAQSIDALTTVDCIAYF